jgi:hypothetical protein
MSGHLNEYLVFTNSNSNRWVSAGRQVKARPRRLRVVARWARTIGQR